MTKFQWIAAGLALLGAAQFTAPSYAQGAAAPAKAAPAAPAVPGKTASSVTSDYPTDVTADYVFGCMAANGNTRKALEQCSCSFDVVASLLPYERYVEASTFMSMGQLSGEKGSLFRGGAESKAAIGDLRRAQAEAEIRCFE
ncbi:hypothetical protein [Aurantimonas sp. VKM B-3413]|uniref:hypothetical protein n=1 Tax=Aurantimonas sp. VKM B-3413 TaxID=2779401 RepID=UPI001E590227|nr:hypothetical protein [Aurantimonas sp. VKM B-3413]MCB8838261.1 hypothetical protein [Aurantimonas sp. VKM B-3413]